MALTLVTAPPGSGKTLWMVWRILQLVNERRLVYTNIDGLEIAGVLPIPDWTDDWRDLPNDSVVVYDEAQEHPAFDKYATVTDKTKKAYYHDIAHSLAIHRHFGFDIYLLTQSPNLIAGHVLGFVNKHIHLRRNFGFERATVYHFIEAQTNTKNPKKNGQLENTTTFTYPKSQSYFILDELTPSTLVLNLSGIPAGNYTKIKYGIGVDKAQWEAGATGQGDFLTIAQAAEMMWSWSAGYKFVAFEGTFTSATVAAATQFKVHTGQTGTDYNYAEVALDLPVDALVRTTITPQIHIMADLSQIVDGTNTINLSEGATIMGGAKLALVTANIANMFEVEHVHND